jgi:S-DNA-T family DNA segregation ATPase FtsK/SpoIIIE
MERIAVLGNKSLWSRLPGDDDFLSLRYGSSDGIPSFAIEPPRYSDPNDKLPVLAMDVAREFQKVSNLPAMLNLGTTGSVAVAGRSESVYGLTRRLILDLIVHHSPEDVNIAVLGDTRTAVENWEWLKWLLHTDALNPEKRQFRLAFDPLNIDKLLEFLMSEYHFRRNQADNYSASKKVGNQPTIVVLVDDSGQVRQHGDIHTLAKLGHEAKIHLVFVGGRDWPRECRSRIDLLDEKNFKCVRASMKALRVRPVNGLPGNLPGGKWQVVGRAYLCPKTSASRKSSGQIAFRLKWSNNPGQ